MTAGPPTGADLAKVALAAAKKAAKERGTHTPARRTSRRPAPRGDGRDPLGLGGALAQLVTERGWEASAAAGTVIDRWRTIVSPEIADHLQAVGYEPSTGRLDILPATNAWATQARLISARLIRQANSAVGTQTVRTIRVLPAGSRATGPLAQQSAAANTGFEPRGEVRTRENASPGFHRARAAIGAEPTDQPFIRIRTRQDGCDGYHQVRALVKSPTTPHATDADPPVRTRNDGSDGYRQALERIGAPLPGSSQEEEPVRTRETASAGYQLTRRALLEGRTRTPRASERREP
ncbi:DciA family protein [Streptomyces microflavus]|uniref:DciA family protein n=1 Tax=Streptomyces microflavus TaxID=1919 RepID=UPI003813E269